jgi:putative oxidoreductase
MNIALLALRLVVGLTFAGHGAQKLFGAFGGHGIEGTAASFEQIGLRPGRFNAWLAALTEFIAGVLLALGLVTPVAAAALTAVITVAVLKVHLHHGFFITNNGYEYNVVLAAAVFSLAAIGAGSLSLDYAIGIDLTGVGWAFGALGAGVIAGLGALVTARLASRHGARHGQPHAA